MYIEVSASDVQTSDAIYDHVTNQVSARLKHFGERVTRVQAYLKDVNAKKGGIDKKCMLEARVAGQPPIVAEHEADDLYLAISGAAEKLERAIRKKIDRADPRESA